MKDKHTGSILEKNVPGRENSQVRKPWSKGLRGTFQEQEGRESGWRAESKGKNDRRGCRENQGPHHEGSYKGTVRTLDFKQDGRSWSAHGGLEDCHSWERTMAWTSGTAEEEGHYLSHHTQGGMKEGASGKCLYHSKSVGWQKRKLKKKVIRGWAIPQEVWT